MTARRAPDPESEYAHALAALAREAAAAVEAARAVLVAPDRSSPACCAQLFERAVDSMATLEQSLRHRPVLPAAATSLRERVLALQTEIRATGRLLEGALAFCAGWQTLETPYSPQGATPLALPTVARGCYG